MYVCVAGVRNISFRKKFLNVLNELSETVYSN